MAIMKKATVYLISIILAIFFIITSNSCDIKNPSSSHSIPTTSVMSAGTDNTIASIYSSDETHDITLSESVNNNSVVTSIGSSIKTSNDKFTDDIFINTETYFSNIGRDFTLEPTSPVSKEEFLKRYPISLNGIFKNAFFRFDLRSKDIPPVILPQYYGPEDGVFYCLDNNSKTIFFVTVCDVRYTGDGIIGNGSPMKPSSINGVEVILSYNNQFGYRGHFEKNGIYYTFGTYYMEQDEMIATVKDLIG